MHHIERLIFEHQTPTADGATAQQTAVSRWLSAAFVPMLDRLFSDMTPDDRVLKLDRLVVEVPNVATDISESALLDLCQQAIRKALQTEIGRLLTLNTEGGVFRETETVAFEAFVYFLKNGYLPTAFRVKNEAEWLFKVLAAVSAKPKNSKILRGVLHENPTAKRRLGRQMPVRFLSALMQLWLSSSVFDRVKKIEEQVSGLTEQTRTQGFFDESRESIVAALWVEMGQNADSSGVEATLDFIEKGLFDTPSLGLFVEKNKPTDAFDFVEKMVVAATEIKIVAATETIEKGLSDTPSLGLFVEKNKPTDAFDFVEKMVVAATEISVSAATETIEIPLTEGLEEGQKTGFDKEKQVEIADTPQTKEPKNHRVFYLDAAGMVLIAPYLPMFFKHQNLLEGANFRDEAATEKAIQLLHYLATGKPDMPLDTDLIFEKWLCNTPLSKTTNRHNKLTVNDLEAADGLLRAVISHWAVLGQCSVEGLRETFFKRSGKFGQRPDGHWFLTVERRTVDILVDRLPWTIGMVQRPWRTDEFLFVEW